MNKAQQGQTFLDLVAQSTGSIENAVKMAVLNNVSITDVVAIGSEFAKAGTIKQRTVNYLKTRSAPATGLSASQEAAIDEAAGIGSMMIESTFKVY